MSNLEYRSRPGHLQLRSETWRFWKCAFEWPPGGTWDRDLRWEVPASARVSTPAGLAGRHDDRLVSAALVSLYDELVAAGAVRTGRARSEVIEAVDPLANLSS